MPDYRLYCLDGVGKFTQVHVISAEDDAEAISQASSMQLNINCELWDRGRMVATIEAHERSDPRCR